MLEGRVIFIAIVRSHSKPSLLARSVSNRSKGTY